MEQSRIPLLETLRENIDMFVLHTRNRGTPAAGPMIRKPAQNFIRNDLHNLLLDVRRTFAVQLMKSAESKQKVFFYIDDAEEGESPFLCTPSPESRRYSQAG